MTRRLLIKKVSFYLFASLIGFFNLIPFFWMVSTSLKARKALAVLPVQWIPEEPSFEAYQRLFQLFPFARAIWNSVFISVTTTVIVVVSASLAAYVFAKVPFKGREVLFTLFLMTMMIPGQVTMIPNFLVLRYLGLLNTYLGVLLPTIYNAFATFLLRQNMRIIPDAFLEAAIIDGASHFTIFSRIVVPLSKPILAALSVITFMGTWNDYLWPLIVLTDRAKMTLPVGLGLLNTQYGNQYNLLMAGGLISMVPILLLYFLAQKHFEQGLSIGGIKG
ncbi:MAG: carbohydrate ABC transporter permease [Eubacteriales bacterium]|jgi:multiple sugar transport system permease protein|nr:carbohydrate ABC transporter permease [Bacillota bacterium]MDI9485346.1 carbohydrate ABC transporter permease [Bacillota bacterium]